MVQRYDPDVHCHIADDGDYVEYIDYEKLINSHEKLVKRLQRALRGGETTISKQIIFQALEEAREPK